MSLYRVTLIPQGPLSTPIRGDTVWGHLCWAIRNHRGESALETFLSEQDEEFSVVFSDAFPAGFLPKPHLTPSRGVSRPATSTLVPEDYKREKGIAFINGDLFHTPLSPTYLAEISQADRTASLEDRYHAEERLHNSLNRITGAVLDDGGLYGAEHLWTRGPQDLYVASELPKPKVSELVKLCFADGYGADRSTGFGRISVGELQETDLPTAGNRWLALGPFVPNGGECRELRADVFTRFGRLGDVWAHRQNPFKRPVVMYETGATFERAPGSPSLDYVGSLLQGVHEDERIRQMAAAPVVPIVDAALEAEASR